MIETVRRNLVAEPVTEFAGYRVLVPDSTVGAGLRMAMASGLRNLKTAAQRAASDRPDSIHRFRVALRRLRSVLSAFGKILPTEERHALSQRLASLARSYSGLREWDVFLANIVGPLAEALPDEPAVAEIEAAVRETRRHALPDNGSLRRQADEVIATIEAASWLQRPNSPKKSEWESDLKDFSSNLLAKQYRRLRKRLKNVDITSQTDFHKLRIQVKKIRYQIEIFSNLYDDEATDPYLDRMIAVQDALGSLNDALVAHERLGELGLSSRAQGLVSGWLAHEVAARRERFPRTAKRLRKATPFWEE